jgi:[protein-PII] uridylyltransferase
MALVEEVRPQNDLGQDTPAPRPFTRAALDAEIAELHANAASAGDVRPLVIECFRRALENGRAAARAELEAGGRGSDCARALSNLQDNLIAAIHDYVLTYVNPPGNADERDQMTIAAVGGYGRGTLAPGSDVDLLFLVRAKQTGWVERVVESILYVLWDLKQKVGHSTRSVIECLRQARDDLTIRTALLEARYILGNNALFEDLRKRFEQEIVRTTAREFVSSKLGEREARVVRAGTSRYLVEPNVKEGKGGLRDLNTLFWIGKYVYRVRQASDLVDAGLFTPSEYALFVHCEDFLWRVRCHMHFITGRAEERLSFELQRVLASRFGYKNRGGLSAVERFMKHYFLIAKDVGDLTAIVCAALEARAAKPRAMLDRFVRTFRRRRKALPSPDFAIETDRITVARPDIFEKDPVNLIRLFWIADQSMLAIHPDAARLVTRSLRRIDASLRNDPEANRLFLEILTSRHVPEVVLRRMNEAGVLGRFIPEFGQIVAMMQFNMYHHYTVDEHLLRAVGILADIEAHRLVEDHPLTDELLPTISNRTPLCVALFLHDIAKGRREDHSKAGAEVARRLSPRLGLSEAETETTAWLIENHLIMSDTAQRRDLGDPTTIETFANRVQTLERLKMLLILTVCDIRAVGPGVWNGWKGELLRTLYWETEVVLAGGHSALDRQRRVEKAQQELRGALPAWSDPDFEAYAQRHYPAYWLKTDLEHRIKHAKLLHLAAVEMRSLETEVATDAFRGVTELTVVAPDHPRLLAIIAGACASASANIVDAQIFTTTDGLALDTIFVSRAFDEDHDELRRAKRVAQAIEKTLRGEIRLRDAIAAKKGAAKPQFATSTFPIVPQVTLDNNLSKRYTVIEVSGLDRLGLLYDITTILSALNLNIGSAHIVTFGEKAVDVFYVTDLTGAKITNAARQGAIRRHLLEVFSEGERKQIRASG